MERDVDGQSGWIAGLRDEALGKEQDGELWCGLKFPSIVGKRTYLPKGTFAFMVKPSDCQVTSR